MRSTVQPAFVKPRVTARSRALFRASFASQNFRFCLGLVPCRGHPCQKQPSTNTATRSARNTNSGRTCNALPAPSFASLRSPLFDFLPLHVSTRSFTWRLHPVIPAARISPASFYSVSLFPVERMRDMTSERLAGVKTSGIALA